MIIDYDRIVDTQDEKRERRIRYMQSTRARKTLLVRFGGGRSPSCYRRTIQTILCDKDDKSDKGLKMVAKKEWSRHCAEAIYLRGFSLRH